MLTTPTQLVTRTGNSGAVTLLTHGVVQHQEEIRDFSVVRKAHVWKLVQHYAHTVKLYSDMFRWRQPPSSEKTTTQTKIHRYWKVSRTHHYISRLPPPSDPSQNRAVCVTLSTYFWVYVVWRHTYVHRAGPTSWQESDDMSLNFISSK